MKLLVLFVLLLIYNTTLAQDTAHRRSSLFYTVRSTDVLVGVHWQGNSREDKTLRYYEIGIAKGKYISTMESYFGMAVYASEEMYFSRDKNIYGTKIGVWAHWLFDVGASAIYYTDFKRGNFKIRPEFGVGVGRIRVVCGYNIPTVNNKAFEELRRNTWQGSVQLTAGLRKKKTYN